MIELAFLKELILIKQVHQKCDICHYWYFLDEGFRFQPHVCNGCHDVLMMSTTLITLLLQTFVVLTIDVLLVALAKAMLYIYSKMLTWPRREEYYKNKKKNKKFITICKWVKKL